MTTPAAPDSRPTRRLLGLVEWPERVTTAERRSLVAGGLGWMLDAMDFMLLAMVLSEVMRDFGVDTSVGGLLNSLGLVSSAFGGMLFGVLADKIGRTRALMLSILVYSLATGACGLANSVVQLGIFRFLLGLGMGGEWNTGAALIAETWPAEHRGKALGLMQSAWAIGEILAAVITLVVLERFGWRVVFFIGVLPALLVLWIRRRVPEPEIWVARGKQQPVRLALLWQRRDLRRNAIIATAMNACTMFGYWGLFTWIPTYLKAPIEDGGRGLAVMTSMTWVIVMAAGKWFGYASFGFAADRFGRRRSYFTFLLAAATLVPLYGMVGDPVFLFLLGPLVGFFGTGYFSGFGAIASELFPTEIRASAMGITYNIGRGFAALAPLAVGTLALHVGLGAAFLLQAGAFLAAALLALLLPETLGKQLE
jgi:MFS family permease